MHKNYGQLSQAYKTPLMYLFSNSTTKNPTKKHSFKYLSSDCQTFVSKANL